jgi:hypothetical protein
MQPDNQSSGQQQGGGMSNMPQYGAPTQPIMPSMTPPKKKGGFGVIITLILTILLLFGAIAFGLWAYMSMQDYKVNSDKKVAAAVVVANKKTSDEKDKEYVEKEKSPYKEYLGPATFGSVKIVYPKTWSAYIDEKNSSPYVDGFWHPNFVPSTATGTAYALRMQVLSSPYDQVIKAFDSKVKSGDVKLSPYRAPLVPGVLGSRVDGQITKGQKDSMVIFPLRDKTLQVWTESDQFLGDFNNTVLANLTFSP